jgi:hypothetical protein
MGGTHRGSAIHKYKTIFVFNKTKGFKINTPKIEPQLPLEANWNTTTQTNPTLDKSHVAT